MRLLIAFLLSLSIASAEDIYIAMTAQGGDTGADAANAHSRAWFNTSGNWGAGAGKISAGDTVHLCGTFTDTITIQASGTAGSPITVLFESGAKFSAETWTTGGSSGIIYATGKSYIIVDGNNTGVNFEATNTGSDLTYTSGEYCCIYFTGTFSDVEIKNLTMTNLYHRVQNASTSGQAHGVILGTASGPNHTRVKVHNNKISWARYGIAGYYSGGSDYECYSNVLRYVDAGVVFGSVSASVSYTNCSLHDNDISDAYVWDHPSNSFHHESIHFWGYGPDVTGLKVYNNYCHGNYGTYFTASLYYEGQASNNKCYNNILTSPIRHIYMQGPTPSFVMNNTIVGSGFYLDIGNSQTCTFGNNICYNTDGPGAGGNGGYASGTTYTNTITADPLFVNAAAGNYRLQEGSPAINEGADYSAYFTTDADGNTRTGTWDIGAYEYGGGTPPATPAKTRVRNGHANTLKIK